MITAASYTKQHENPTAKFETIYHQELLIALGAFTASPFGSLYTEANEKIYLLEDINLYSNFISNSSHVSQILPTTASWR